MNENIKNILNKLNPKDRADIVKDLAIREISLQEDFELLKNTNELIKAVNSTNSIEEMFEITQKKLSSVIDTANFIIALIDKESNRIVFPYFVDEKDDISQIVGETNSISADQEGSLTVEVIKTGKPAVFTKDQVEKIDSKLDDKSSLGSIPHIWYGFPLKIKDETIGAIIIQSYSKSFDLNEKNFKFLEYISSHLAPSIERRIVEDKLKRSEEKYRELFEKSEDAILIIESGKFVDCNDATVLMLKYKNKNELLQTHPSQLSPEKQPDGRYSAEKADEMIAIALKKGSNRFEWDHKKSDGEIFPVEVLLTSIKNEAGIQIIHTVWRDITERKNAERTIIENQRLGAIGEMASAVAHDFNNALQSILGYIELSLVYTEIPEKLKKYIMIMKKAAIDASTRVQLLQRFGGKKTNKNDYTQISINSLVSDVIEQSRPIWKDGAEKDGIEIKVEVKYSKIPEILGNEEELRSVLYNIIKNSVESIEDYGNIFIKTAKKKENICITIEDTGIGMDSETASRVFQPLFSSKGFELGRGYGMSGAYSIIQEHSGNVNIKKSIPGKGTVVEILLPYIDKHSKSKNIEKDYSNSLKGIKILWVDDDHIIRDIAKQYIKELDMAGDVVESGFEALEILEKKKYDLVITDIGMAKMNGWELAKTIKEKYNNKIKVAVITGWGAQVNSDLKKENGVEYVLGKPITLNQIIKLINEITIS